MQLADQIRTLLLADMERFLGKGLFGQSGDSFSMRIPGQQDLLLVKAGDEKPERAAIRSPGDGIAGLHARLYGIRPDAGALLLSSTPWSAALADLDATIPVLFDEQARHLGKVEASVSREDISGLERAISRGGNAAIFGDKRLCLGLTPERIVLNAELFEKCAEAFVIAYSTGRKIHRIPWWVRAIASRRMKKDQVRAAESLAAGRIPEGMNAY